VSTGTTGRTGKNISEPMGCFLGSGMLPKAQRRQTFLAMCLYKTERFTLNFWQRYGSMLAIEPDKAQFVLGSSLGITNG